MQRGKELARDFITEEWKRRRKLACCLFAAARISFRFYGR
jgi:hypothetical protein